MADVRLTATNPADSSVVPVACNERGELKLEEIPDQSFDGNLDGDLTVSGSASFAGDAVSKSSLISTDGVINAAELNTHGLKIRSSAGPYLRGEDVSGNQKVIINADGSAKFTGKIETVGDTAAFHVGTDKNSNKVPFNIYDTSSGNRSLARIMGDGSVSFAGNKAGFTAEGYLWCTTRRGDTVILDFTSNGTAQWAPYTPPTRLTELQDRWAEKDGILPVPEESSQDEPEIPQ